MMQQRLARSNPFEAWHLHIECEFQLGFSVRVVHFEQPVNEFFQIDVATRVEIQHCKEAFPNDSGQLTVL